MADDKCNTGESNDKSYCDYCGKSFDNDDLNHVGESLACYDCVEGAVIEAYTRPNTEW
jgi:hypothetical protein